MSCHNYAYQPWICTNHPSSNSAQGKLSNFKPHPLPQPSYRGGQGLEEQNPIYLVN